MNSNPMISPVPKPAPGAQTTSPSGQAAPAAISVKPDAAGGTGEVKNTKTMNTRNALIDVLVNRCKDRAGKPEGAVENAGTSEGTRKKNCTARDVIVTRKAANSTMLAQMSPSPMIGSYAEGKRQKAKNSGTSEGVKKGWEKRRGKEFQHPGTGKMYHFNEETGLWHDRKGEPTRMSGIISHLEKQANNAIRGSDSVRWAREFLRKSRAQPGKPKVDSTKWAREALVALKAHKPVTNDHRAEALEAGIKVELEHGPDRALAEKIARDHLREDPEYYTKLKRCGVK